MIPCLRCLNHRLVEPLIHHIGCNDPLYGTLRFAGRHFATYDEPAVVMVHAAVVKFQCSPPRLDSESVVRVIGANRKSFSLRVRFRDNVIGDDGTVPFATQLLHRSFTFGIEITPEGMIRRFLPGGTVGLLRKYPGLTVHHPWFSKKCTGEEFQVKPHLAEELLGNRTVHIDSDHHGSTFTPHIHPVVEHQIGIDHGVETGQMAGGIGKGKPCSNSVAIDIHIPFDLFGNRLPLTRRRFQANVSVGRHSVAVHDQGYPTLMSLGVDIVVSHHLDTPVLKITGCAKLKILTMQRGERQQAAASQQKEKN
ncbi:MAG: hypothetical protein WCY58_07320 [Mariniphaga sp.]